MSRPRILTASVILLCAALAVLIAGRGPILERLLLSRAVRDAGQPGEGSRLSISYPRPGTLFPPEIPAPTVMWADSTPGIKRWLLSVRDGKGFSLASALANRPSWRPAPGLWETIKAAGLAGEVRIDVYGSRGWSLRSAASTVIRVSPDSVGAPIFFRAVPLPFSYALKNLDSIRWHLGDVASEAEPPALLKNLSLCGNCHSFSADGRVLAMDVDYANDKGSYVIADVAAETVFSPERIITWSDFRREDGRKTFGLLSKISPDGRHAVSTVKDRSVFVPVDDLHYSQLFFPVKGVLAVYDREAGTFRALPGADDPAFVQSSPAWSPDGRSVYFSKSPAYRSERLERSSEAVLPASYAAEFLEGRRGFRYDIHRLAFNGGRGGKAEPLAGASANGQSNFFPRPSPDGRWVVFTRAANFMLLQRDSRLWIVPAAGGTPRLMACNTDSMNSWHSWSPNGRWLVFASKVLGPYTAACLTHVDSAGNDTPPVILERFRFRDRAVNIPEFVNVRPEAFRRITDRFTEQAHYWWTIGKSRLGEKRFTDALAAFDRALGLDSTFAEAHLYAGHAHSMKGDYGHAVEAYDRAIRLRPEYGDAWANRGSALYRMGKFPEAVASYDRAEKTASDPVSVLTSRGLALSKLGEYGRAIRDFDRALAGGGRTAAILYERGLCRALLADYVRALADFREAAALEPGHAEAHAKTGSALYRLGRFREAEEAYGLSLKYRPGDREARSFRAACRLELNDTAGALEDYNEALRIEPDSAGDLMNRGLLRIRLGDRAGACADLSRARSLGLAEADAAYRKHCGQ